MFRYFEINEDGCNIRCKLYAEPKTDIRKLVIFCHGFAGHKDNSAAATFAEKLLSKYKGTALLTFDLPCHGDDVRKKLTLEDCDTYLTHVLGYAEARYPDAERYGYGVSFGGYLLLKYIADHGMPFRRAVLRAPAINMYESLKNIVIMNGEYERLQKGKAVPAGFDRKVEVTEEFLESLRAADIRQREYFDWADDLIILHGTADEVVPFAESEAFAENNVIQLYALEGADHRFQNPKHRDFATKTILEFFNS